MPGFQEVLQYLSGVWLLARGRSEGFRLLDISADGFWRSFAAIGWSLPALFLSWISYRRSYSDAIGVDDAVGPLFVPTLALIDLINWLAPLVLLGLLARPLGIAQFFARYVIATNWLSLAFAYVFALPVIWNLLYPEAGQLTALVSLILLVLAFAAFIRVARLAFDNDMTMALAVTIGTFVFSLILTGFLQRLFGVGLP